jgi:hypothetical protein
MLPLGEKVKVYHRHVCVRKKIVHTGLNAKVSGILGAGNAFPVDKGLPLCLQNVNSSNGYHFPPHTECRAAAFFSRATLCCII